MADPEDTGGNTNTYVCGLGMPWVPQEERWEEKHLVKPTKPAAMAT